MVIIDIAMYVISAGNIVIVRVGVAQGGPSVDQRLCRQTNQPEKH